MSIQQRKCIGFVLSVITLILGTLSVYGQERYAVIVAGNPHQASYCERFWAVTSGIYDVLVNRYGYSSENIYFLFYDRGDCHHADDPRVDMVATKQNIRTIFEEELLQVRSPATLFCFFVGLGNTTGGNSLFTTGTAYLQDYVMATMKEGLPASFTEQTYVFTQPNSGRFAKTLSNAGTVTITSSKMEEGKNRDLSPFARLFRDGLDHAVGADANSDGRISIGEAYLYALQGVAEWSEGRAAEHPQIDDNGDKVSGCGIPSPTGDGTIALDRYLK